MRAGQAGAAEAPREVEIKFELTAGDAARLGRTALLGDVIGRTAALSAVYFDTADHALRQAGISLRIREAGGLRMQTIKARRDRAASPFDRDEWEQEIAGDAPDLTAAAGTALEPLLADGRVRAGVGPVFAVRVERTTYELDRDGSAAELTLDQGRIEADGRIAELCEVELELKRGEPSDLFAAARALSDEVALRLEVRSKAERGYALLENKRPKAVKATKDLPLSPGMTTAAAFQAIARACLLHLVANERIAQTRDPDVVHQMRVAMRRLRAAVALFKDVLADDRRDAIRAELKWAASELGAARDLDVFLAGVIEPVRREHPGEAGLAELADAFRARREAAYDEALAAITSRRFRRLVIDLAAWIEAGPWLTQGDGAARAEPVEDFAAAQLARRRKKLRKRGAHLAELDPHGRHRVRIEGKKLRYAAEFFAPLYEGGKARKRKEAFLSALEDLQERLGELNDLAVSREMHPDLFREAETGGDPGWGEAARLIVRHQERRADAALEPALEAYRFFARAKRFWR